MMHGRTGEAPHTTSFAYGYWSNVERWVAERMPHAIAFAERDMAETARARAYHLARARERGTCAIGHDLTQPTPINRLGTHPCGYCTSAKEAA